MLQRSATNLIQVPILNQVSPNPNSIPATQTTANHSSNTLRHTSKSKVQILHLNARSLKNHENLHQIRELTRVHKPGVLAISESWLNSKGCNVEVEIDGYKLLRLDRLHKPGGGVCAYVRTECRELTLTSMIVRFSTIGNKDNYHIALDWTFILVDHMTQNRMLLYM